MSRVHHDPSIPEFLARQLDLVDRWHQAPYAVTEDTNFQSLLTVNIGPISAQHEEDLARDPDATDVSLLR